MKKVLIYTKSLEAGTGTFVEALSKINKRTNIDLKILSSELPKTTKPFTFTWLGSDVRKDRYFFNPILVVRLAREIINLRQQINKFSPQFILTVDSYCLLLCHLALFGMRNRPRLIATVHNNLPSVIEYKIPPILQLPIRKFIGISLRQANEVVTISQGLARSLRESFELIRKPRVIYYGITNNRIAAKSNLSKEPILLSVGRLHQQKNFSLVIRAYHLFQRGYPKSKLWVVGDGPLRPKLVNLVKELGLENKVKFFGWQKNPERFYRKADLFVFASNWEGFGWVILEAMNQALPVVATDTPFGPRELLGNSRYGRLCRTQNPEDLARDLERTLTGKSQYLQASRLSLVRSKEFDQAKMLKQYLSLFES